MGSEASMRKAPTMRNRRPQSRFYLQGDEDGFESKDRDGDSKAIPGPAPLPSLAFYELSKVPTDPYNLSSNRLH